jgi:hypothetical protein
MSREWADALLLPSLERADVLLTSARVQVVLGQVALALSAFRAEHGAYPASLAELSPAYLRVVPIDAFADRPLIYASHGERYTLYSVGPDTKDDGGKSGAGDDVIASHSPTAPRPPAQTPIR